MQHTRKLLSPKDLAVAIGSSESSLKRWTDQGRLSVSRTAGGHRRIPLNEAIRFIRSNRLPIVQPEILGLPASFGVESDPQGSIDGLEDADFTELLRSGHDIGARNLMMQRFMNGESIASLADGPIRTAMHGLGEFWKAGPEGILVEHRATEICSMIIQDLRAMATPETPRGRAIGGAVEGDPYKLPPLVAAAVLGECGLHAVNLGADTPIEVLRLAALAEAPEERPDLLWVNVSSTTDATRLTDELAALSEACESAGVRLAAGGRLIAELDLDARTTMAVHSCMREFGAYLELTFPEKPADPGTA